MKYLSDFKQYGFKPAEIIAFLAGHGINIGEVPVSSNVPEYATTKAETIPEWKLTMSLMPFFTNYEAACILANYDLDMPGYMSDDDGAFIRRKETLIIRAIQTGGLAATVTDHTDDYSQTPTAWSIKPADLMAWCGKNGIEYPLPVTTAFPQTDTGLREALTESESERAKLKAIVAALEAQGDQREALQAEVNNLRAELRGKADNLAAIVAERDRLKSDAVEGKAKTTLLKIIGGLAIGGYGMDIRAQQLRGIGDMVKDLQTNGVDVTEKTLRERIQEAAGFIDKPKAK